MLWQYSLGISTNEGIKPEIALIFAYQVLNDQIVEVLNETKNDVQQDTQQTKEGKRPESCLVLEKEPNRLFIFISVNIFKPGIEKQLFQCFIKLISYKKKFISSTFYQFFFMKIFKNCL